eukprot:136820_1
MRKKIQNIQFLLLNKATTHCRIQEYIINELQFHITKIYNNQCTEWCDNLMETLKQLTPLKNSNQPIINIYNSETERNINRIIFTKYKQTDKMFDTPLADVDEYFYRKDSYNVFEENGITYSTTLYAYDTVDDVGSLRYDKFYKIQILKDKLSFRFYVWIRYGIDGYDGRMESHAMAKNECIHLFKERFYEKTGNRWEDRKDFVAQCGFYEYLVSDFSCAAVHADFRVITFELNDKYFGDKNNKIGKDKDMLLCPKYSTLKQFTIDESSKFCVWFINSDNNFEKQLAYFNLENDFNADWTVSNIELEITPLTTVKMIQNKISLRFKNIVPANYIQIYGDVDDKLSDYKQIFSGNNPIENTPGSKVLKWMIVPYDTFVNDVNNMKIYKISIYEQEYIEKKDYICENEYVSNNLLNIGYNWSNNYNYENEKK